MEGAEIAITNKAPIRMDTLERHPDLKLIAVAATGYDVVEPAGPDRTLDRRPCAAACSTSST